MCLMVLCMLGYRAATKNMVLLCCGCSICYIWVDPKAARKSDVIIAAQVGDLHM